MPEKKIMHAIGAERRATEVGKHNLSIAARRFMEPSFQYGHCWFGKRRASFLSAFPNHADMSALTESDFIARQPGHL
jgi:hypothetical protein